MSSSKAAPIDKDDLALFREAVRDVKPLPAANRYPMQRVHPKPLPYKTLQDEQQALVDSLSDALSWEDFDDEGNYLRPGTPKHTLRKLRARHWIIQGELDLHGMITAEAKMGLVEFLKTCQKRNWQCVRIIHGKGLGSKNGQPVLRNKVRNWLRQRNEVIAFCQAKPVDGGAGATLVLLKRAH